MSVGSRKARFLVAAIVLSSAMPFAAAEAHPFAVYAPEFVCPVSMSTPGQVRACVVDISEGNWHIDLNAAFVLEGSYTLRVEIPSGEFAELRCSHTRELAGPTQDRCSFTFAGLADEGGGGARLLDASAYLHVHLPVSGRVIVSGDEGNGILIARGARDWV